jgi:hypothetical protein
VLSSNAATDQRHAPRFRRLEAEVIRRDERVRDFCDRAGVSHSAFYFALRGLVMPGALRRMATALGESDPQRLLDFVTLTVAED